MSSPRSNAAPLLIAGELLLGLLGAALSRWQDVPLAERLHPGPADPLWALAGLAPLVGLLAWVQRTRWRPLARLRRMVRRMICDILSGAQWWELALVAAAAGLGEEILFRGALQPLAARWWGPWIALIAVSFLFGAVHAASAAYFVTATLLGAYLGWLSLAAPTLVVPILVHAAYDWIALAWLLRHRRRRL